VTLIVYSLHASPLGNVWGGFLHDVVTALIHNRQLRQAANPFHLESCRHASAPGSTRTLAAVALVRFTKLSRNVALLSGMGTRRLVYACDHHRLRNACYFVSMLQILAWPHRGFTTIVMSHVSFSPPTRRITIQSRLQSRRPVQLE